MIRYADFRPTQFDSKGLGLEERQDWLVVGVSRNRDSSVLEESNFQCALTSLQSDGGADDVEVHRFGHWGPGWFELILVRPDSAAAEEAEEIEAALSYYPVLDDSDYSERCVEAAERAWRDCYRTKDRIEFIRKHRSEFEFHGFADLLACARGRHFCGDTMSMAEGN